MGGIGSTTVALYETLSDANADTNRLDLDATGTVGTTFNLGQTIDPSTAIIDSANSINLGYAHGFQLGQAVVYRAGGDAAIGGLVDGGIYYVVPDAVNPNVFQLAATELLAELSTPVVIDLDSSASTPTGALHGFGVAFDSFVDIDADNNQIDLGYNHGFSDGTEVIYDDGANGVGLIGA